MFLAVPQGEDPECLLGFRREKPVSLASFIAETQSFSWVLVEKNPCSSRFPVEKTQSFTRVIPRFVASSR